MYKLEVPGEKPRVPILAIAIMILLIVGVIALVILIGLQRPDSSTQAGSVEFAIATQVLAPGEDIVIGVNNATLYVPGDAISISGSIAIFPRAPNLFATLGDTRWIRLLVVNVEFRDGDGKRVQQVILTKPAEICFKITKERWEDYTRHPNEYEVQTYSEEKDPPLWEPLPMLAYPERSQLCGQIKHISLFALATKPETSIPLTDPTPTLNPTQEILDKSSGDRPEDIYEP